eukprot:932212-Rhodomonas_salina.2
MAYQVPYVPNPCYHIPGPDLAYAATVRAHYPSRAACLPPPPPHPQLSLIHISEPTRPRLI